VHDRSDRDATSSGRPPSTGWLPVASIRASGTLGTVDLFSDPSTDGVLLQIHERDDDGTHLVEAAIRLDRKAARALALLLEREAAR
jgi:hypothetical protein